MNIIRGWRIRWLCYGNGEYGNDEYGNDKHGNGKILLLRSADSHAIIIYDHYNFRATQVQSVSYYAGAWESRDSRSTVLRQLQDCIFATVSNVTFHQLLYLFICLFVCLFVYILLALLAMLYCVICNINYSYSIFVFILKLDSLSLDTRFHIFLDGKQRSKVVQSLAQILTSRSIVQTWWNILQKLNAQSGIKPSSPTMTSVSDPPCSNPQVTLNTSHLMQCRVDLAGGQSRTGTRWLTLTEECACHDDMQTVSLRKYFRHRLTAVEVISASSASRFSHENLISSHRCTLA